MFHCNPSQSVHTPVDPFFPSFVIAAFPSDKREDATTLLSRWKEIEKLAVANGIKIIAHGSDGEAKQLKAMRLLRSHYSNYWEIDSNVYKGLKIPIRVINGVMFPECCFQDPIHVGTKLRNNLLAQVRVLMLHLHRVSLAVVMDLLQQVTELDIKVRSSDMAPKDKMNFDAVRRLCSDELMNEVMKKGDTALYLYLKLIKFAVFSFVNPEKLESNKWRMQPCLLCHGEM
jgi:hypothetical protein